MNSIKTKTKTYSLIKGRAVAAVNIISSKGGFEIYVVWEWAEQADKGFFAITKSDPIKESKYLNHSMIQHVADYGRDVTHLRDARGLFPNIFMQNTLN